MSKVSAAERRMYHIRVQGNLDRKWVGWFEGFALTCTGDGETVMVGSVADQAALYGVLVKINALGLPLLLVLDVDEAGEASFCPACGRYAASLPHTPGP